MDAGQIMDFLTILLVVVILVIGIFIGYLLGQKIGTIRRDRHWEAELPNHRKDAVLKSRAVLGGMFSEQLAPFLPDFPFNPNEVRFIGKPVDFIAFKGMDDKNIEEVSFIEVKSGNSKLNNTEKSLKEAIKNKKVSWEEYKIPEDLTKGKELDFEG